MKFVCLLGLALWCGACTYSERADWDSGAMSQEAYEEKAQEEEAEWTNRNLPEVEKPNTEAPQPF